MARFLACPVAMKPYGMGGEKLDLDLGGLTAWCADADRIVLLLIELVLRLWMPWMRLFKRDRLSRNEPSFLQRQATLLDRRAAYIVHTELGFTITDCTPTKQRYDLEVSSKLAPHLLQFIDHVGMEREALYSLSRLRLQAGHSNDSQQQFTPYRLVKRESRLPHTGMMLPPAMESYVRRILVEEIGSTLASLYDRMAVLLADPVRQLLGKDVRLAELAATLWLPEYLAGNVDVEISFDPIIPLPSKVAGTNEGDVRVSKLRIFRPTEEAQLKLLLDVLTQYSSAMACKASLVLQRRLLAFSLASIFTSLDIPRLSKSAHLEIILGRCAGLDRYGKPSVLDIVSRMVFNLLPLLLSSEIWSLLAIVFSAQTSPASRAFPTPLVRQVLCSSVQDLSLECAFAVFGDVEMSSWHHQTITARVLCCNDLAKLAGTEEDPVPPAIVINTTTVMIFQLVLRVIDSRALSVYAKECLLDAPPPVYNAVVVWSAFASPIAIAQRLNEVSPVTKQRETDFIPPVGQNRCTARLAAEWVRYVIEPVVLGQMRERNRYLKLLVARVVGDMELDARMPFPLLSYVVREFLADHFSAWKEDAIRFSGMCCARLMLYRKRAPLVENFEGLTEHALAKASYRILAVAHLIRMVFLTPQTYAASVLRALTSAFLDISASLYVLPDNAFLDKLDEDGAIPFALLTDITMGYLSLTPAPRIVWEERMRPIVSRLLGLVETQEQNEALKSRHTAARYWPVRGAHHLRFPRNFSAASSGWYDLPTKDIVTVARLLTCAPICPAELNLHRALCFEMALLLLKTILE
ncbi:hypothetical protein EW146_g3785 [Bondarzewia mesenterica]|uniref:Uncharacterized protein n=1 Tax=Bondarzewia mesenterica TaxID=1095465 RepID=A0A4S4LWR2_9AGAM|nr:hypothetical protein EW146_g3785 [Bondarzewia mesenterica]